MKITYKIFGYHEVITSNIHIDDIQAFKRILSVHVSSSSMYLWVPDAGFKIHIVEKSSINTFAYNKQKEIMDLLKNPSKISKYYKEFPIELTKELRESLEDG